MLRKLFPILLPWLTLILVACSSSAANQGPPPDLIIRAKETGLHAIRAGDLKAFGWNLAKLDEKNITLWQGNRPIPYHWVDKGSQRAIIFYAEVHPTRFDDRATYILRADVDAPNAIPLNQLTVEQSVDIPATIFEDVVRSEENVTYLAQVRDGDPWLGKRIFAPGEAAVSINTPAPAGRGGSLRVKVWAATAAPGDIDHHLVFSLNDRELGEDAWDGNGSREIELAIPPGLLTDGENQLTIAAPGDTGAAADLVYLNWVEIAYERTARAQNGHILFQTYTQDIGIAGLEGEPLEVWEVSHPDRPVRISNSWNLQNNAIGFQMPEPGPHRIMAASAEGLLTPDEITLAPPPLTMPTEAVDYIVIAHPSLVDAIRPLVDYRQSQGLRTAVVTTDQIYLRFNRGMQSPDAITDFLRWAVESWPGPAPRFVLLAGDASYDPLNYLDAPYKNLVPGKFVPTIEMGETISDNAMADINGDGWQDLAIGRFPAQTPEEIRIMVDKTIAFETSRPAGDWIHQMLFVADDDDPYFNTFNEDHIAMIPNAFTAENLVISPNQNTRQKLLASLNQGRGLVSYMGHGAIDIWAQEEIFRNEDVAELRQDGKLGVFLVWACLNGYFQHPSQRSLGETLLITPEKGAVAGLFPTGQTFPNDQWVMADALFGKALFNQATLGEAFKEAARSLNPEIQGQRDIINTFLLLGDPALRLPWANQGN